MKVLTVKDIEALKTRGFLKLKIGQENIRNDINFDVLKSFKINPSPYMSLFAGIDSNGEKNLVRHLCLKWGSVAESLEDDNINFKNKTTHDVCQFFLSSVHEHRVYFFVEILYQYFFP
tara:strand:+ start:715 stop:1068 length:354 start_codon:yes stop_codon:yes gene_type:complete